MADAPLKGLKVVELARILAGPWLGQTLADLGAEVIKVEAPEGDDTRRWGPPFIDRPRADGTSERVAAYFHAANRGKSSVICDFGDPQDLERLKRLIDSADVVIENFKLGGLRKFGLDYKTLSARNPGLVYASITGFGQDGPRASQPGYDFLIQGMSGIMDLTGAPDAEPQKVGVAWIDIFTGLYGVIAVQAALAERARGGLGQRLDLSLLDCGVAVLANQATNYLLGGTVPHRLGNAHPNICPYDTFETGSEPIFLAVGNNRQFTTLCKLIGRPDLPDDPRFASNSQRNQHRDTLKTLLETALADFDAIELSDRLIKAGVPCGAVRSIDQVIDDPHTRHREMVVDIGGYRGTGSPIKLSRTPASYRRAPPSFAQHSAEVMEERALDTKEYRTVLPGLEDQLNAKRKA